LVDCQPDHSLEIDGFEPAALQTGDVEQVVGQPPDVHHLALESRT